MNGQPSLYLLFRYELKNSLRAYPELLLPLGFYFIMASIFAIILPPSSHSAANLCAGAIWLSGLLAILLSMDRLFVTDYHSGHIHLLQQSSLPFAAIMLVKIINHWLTTLVPLLLITPIIALFYHLSVPLLGLLMLTFGIGSLSLICLNAIGCALTVGLNHRGVFLTLLMVPLQIPLILLGTGAISVYQNGQNPGGILSLLGALAIILLVVSPFVCAWCLTLNDA